MKSYDVIGFGALNVDRLGVVPQIAVDGEALVEKETRQAGGSAANTIAGLGRLGLSTGFIGCVGNDAEGALLIDSFRTDHVDTRLIKKKQGSSGVVMGLVDHEGHRLLNIFPGVNNELSSDDLPDARNLRATFLHLSSFVDQKQLDFQTAFAARLDASVKVTLAPGMVYSRFGLSSLTPLLKRCTVVFLTTEELVTLTRQKGLDGANKLHALGVETVVVTGGANGCHVVANGKTIHVPAFPASVVDTTGAGDAFIAGFLYGLHHGFDPATASVSGNLLSKFCISKVGARSGLPTKAVFARGLEAVFMLQKRKPDKKQNVLVIGSGGREHAIGWKLAQSPRVEKLYFAPGNPGTAINGENVFLKADDIEGLVGFAKTKNIDLTVVGPEISLVAGIVDRFASEGLRIFGPSKQAAQLETSKTWAVEFMARHGLPYPISEIFDKPTQAFDFVKKLDGRCVVKADGLCQGKGVFVCETFSEAQAAIETLMVKRAFGPAGERIVIQEKLEGKEVSAMAFCDGSVAVPLVAAHDYKRAYDDNRGPNTGGMGSVAPTDRVGPVLAKKIHRLLTLTVEAMTEESMPYHGILYAGIMLVSGEPYILEFNCRFGDPETQAQLPLLEGDLLPILEACIDGTLTAAMVRWKKASAVCVVLASEGYPGSYKTGELIRGLGHPKSNHGLIVFHAGTSRAGGVIKTAGGRVLAVTATAPTAEAARKKAYAAIGNPLSFEGMQYRKDIGQ